MFALDVHFSCRNEVAVFSGIIVLTMMENFVLRNGLSVCRVVSMMYSEYNVSLNYCGQVVLHASLRYQQTSRHVHVTSHMCMYLLKPGWATVERLIIAMARFTNCLTIICQKM